MEQKKKKLISTQKTLHPRDDIDRQYVSIKEVGRRLTSIEDCVDASIQGLEDNIKNSKEISITVANINNVFKQKDN